MQDIEKAFTYWTSQFPESHHPLDDERYYKFIDAVAAYDDYVGAEWFQEKLGTTKHNLSKEQTGRLVANFSDLVEYGKRFVNRR